MLNPPCLTKTFGHGADTIGLIACIIAHARISFFFFFFSFWSTIFRSSVLVSAFPTHTRHLLQPAFVLPFLYHLDFLGAALLSRPINDLRKVLSRDPDRDVHHYLFSPTQTTSICKSITRRKALEESKRRREKGDIEHAAERERRDDGREEG